MNNFAACTVSAPNSDKSTVRIIPAGTFRTDDGRPAGLPGFVMDDAAARSVVAQLAAMTRDTVIDYEHQTLSATNNGQPAPAAGWFNRVEWRPGDGLYATAVRWTEKALAMLRGKEYRYLSPVFAFDKGTGQVSSLHSVALTNNPALGSLTDLAALTALPRSPNYGITASSSAQEIAAAALTYQQTQLAQGRVCLASHAVDYVIDNPGCFRIPAATVTEAIARLTNSSSGPDIAQAALAYQKAENEAGRFCEIDRAINHVSMKG